MKRQILSTTVEVVVNTILPNRYRTTNSSASGAQASTLGVVLTTSTRNSGRPKKTKILRAMDSTVAEAEPAARGFAAGGGTGRGEGEECAAGGSDGGELPDAEASLRERSQKSG